jgi:hypothetical protein
MAIPQQAPDSSVAGFLPGSAPGTLPEHPEQIPPGIPLEDYLQQFVAGVAGLDGTMVRPRWQLEPPNLPDVSTDWASLTIGRARPIGYTAIRRHPKGDGKDETVRHEEFDLLLTFYGPNTSLYAGNMYDGLAIWQNYVVLRLAGMALVEVGAMNNSAEFIRQQWVARTDMSITIRRYIRRFYPVLNLLSAQARVTESDSRYTVEVKVDPP